MDIFFTLDKDKNVIPSTYENYEIYRKNNPKHVRHNYIKKYGIRISTVFLFCDHGGEIIDGEYKPLIFETMVFQDNESYEWDDYAERYYTWKEALEGHRKITRDVIKFLRQTKENVL